MAIAFVATRAVAANTTSEGSTTLTVGTGTGATGGTIPVGNFLIARVAVDNSGSAGAAPGLGISGSAGNTWTVLTPALQDPGAASAGIATYICYAPVTNQLTTGDTFLFDWSVTPAAKAIVVEEWSGIDTAAPVAVSAVTSVGSTSPASIAITPTAAGQLVYMALGVEGSSSDTFTGDTDTTNGSWVTTVATGAGTTTSGAAIRGQYKIVTASGAQNWGPTFTARDRAAIGLVFAASIPPVAKSASDTLSVTVTEGTPTIVKQALLFTEGFEDDTLDLTITSGDWIRTSSQFHSGAWSYTNADISDGGTSEVNITAPADALSIDFWYRVSSESGWDYFRFLVNGVEIFKASGTVAWTNYQYTVVAGDTITFRYTKDSSQSVGEDSAYVDDVSFWVVGGPPPVAKTPTDTLSVNISGVSTVAKAGEQLLAPDAILTQTNITGAVTDIDEDPTASDGVWMTGTGAVTLRLSFPTPSATLVSDFEQEFRIRMRPTP